MHIHRTLSYMVRYSVDTAPEELLKPNGARFLLNLSKVVSILSQNRTHRMHNGMVDGR